MDENLTDEQEVDRAKQWVRENGAFLVAGVVLGLGGLFGWQQWQTSQLDHRGQASLVWEQMQTAINSDRINEVSETLAILEKDFANTPYLGHARLGVARMYMDRNKPEQAAEQLRLLAQESGDEQIRRIAELRLAQVLLYQQQYEETLDMLDDENDSAFAGQYHELRGDAYASLGQFDKARDAYLQALATIADGVINREYVGYKLEDVKGLLLELEPPAAETDAVEPEVDAKNETDSADAEVDDASANDAS